MTKQEIQAYRNKEAEIALNQYTAGSSIYEEEHFRQGYIEGFDKGAELERKRAQVLIDAVNSVIFWTRDGRQDLRTHHRISKALSAYEKEIAE